MVTTKEANLENKINIHFLSYVLVKLFQKQTNKSIPEN